MVREPSNVKTAGHGANALDFHIAFHIGHLAAQDPTAVFQIISKDKGFDPLIQHLKDRKIMAFRSVDVADIPSIKAAGAKSTPEKINLVVQNLRQRGTSRPRTLKTLSSTINSMFQKQLTEDGLSALLKGLENKGFIAVDDTKITYALPE